MLLMGKLNKMDHNSYERTYNMIIEKEGTYSNQVSSLFNALLTSTNQAFSDSVNDHLGKWEDKEDYLFEKLKMPLTKSTIICASAINVKRQSLKKSAPQVVIETYHRQRKMHRSWL